MHDYRFTAFDASGAVVFADSLSATRLDDAIDLARIWFTMGVDRASAILEYEGETVARFNRDEPGRPSGAASDDPATGGRTKARG